MRLGPQSCSEALVASGMIAVSQAGFFSDDPSRLPPGRPNVPVLYLRIGNVRTWAQIDTGYDDTVLRPSIDINEALHQQLLVSGLALEPARQLDLTTCEGREQRQVLKVKDAKVTIRTHTGTVIRELAAPISSASPATAAAASPPWMLLPRSLACRCSRCLAASSSTRRPKKSG